MDNSQIADAFSLLSKLIDIHGENSFKAKSYAIAAYTIEKLPVALSALPDEKIFTIKGIGDTIGKKIMEMRQSGKLNALEIYLQKTPPGVLEMLHIKGLGPKKIAVIWKEMGLETIGELLYACNENRLLLFKGFGEKTQQNVKTYIEFYLRSKGSYLYAGIEPYALSMQQQLQKQFPNHRFVHTGAFARQLETIDKLEWVSTAGNTELEQFFSALPFSVTEKNESGISFKTEDNIVLTFYAARDENFGSILFHTCCSGAFLNEWEKRFPSAQVYSSEEQVFKAAGVPYLPPCLREKETIIAAAMNKPSLQLIQPEDVKAVIHSHSNWSDGRQSIEEMARAAIEKGFEYLVISDHSKSAFYANGLKEDRVKEQHLYIDNLNEQLRPFKIFKSIESDILNDGSLDYPNQVLATFDLVIASVHANLKMTEDKAMLRLLTAIQNPYTTILGHMTGRLLLSREGYPVDHKTLIDACVEHHVVIELNAHPRRLDMDRRWIDYALEKGAVISIDPDAHHTEGYNDIRYGVLAAQKAGLTRQSNLSSYSLQEFEFFLQKRKEKKGI
ncbi:PHP domain-containing protein [Agriterribacter sp.]|uniref:PHP domain-containing protein n=1 Tax=Agriterribacter sp. TaxID=2821509 RepID=UPI002C4AC332|nr:PHP domain-containing protein [Agriterribacter sp.]HRO46952.1 PHP domain-containing protein [Agriterribacter sp.]HRQ18997.1 PHP domain-containing protein [Agriterribacter sp.]